MPISDSEREEFERQKKRYNENPCSKNLPDQCLGDRVRASDAADRVLKESSLLK